MWVSARTTISVMRGSRSFGDQHRPGRGAVAPGDAQRQAGQLVATRRHPEEVEALDDHDAGAEEDPVDGVAVAGRFDRERVGAHEADAALDEPPGAVLRQGALGRWVLVGGARPEEEPCRGAAVAAALVEAGRRQPGGVDRAAA